MALMCIIICLLPLCGCKRKYNISPKTIFKLNALNDSLNQFISCIEDFPEANAPTRVFIYAFLQDDRANVVIQSYPGLIRLFSSRDTSSIWSSRTGIYRGRYTRIWYSSSAEYLFKRRALTSMNLREEDRLFLKNNPGFSGEIIEAYFNERKYEVTNSISVKSVR